MLVVRCELPVRAPAARCFDLARSVDLHVDSSAAIGARAVGGRRGGLSAAGDETTWSARFLGLRFRLTTRVEDFDPPRRFDDRLTRGLLRRFAHTYRCEDRPGGEGCTLADELTVEAPFGPLGRLFERVYLARRMRGLVRSRLEHIRAVAESEDWRRYLPGANVSAPPSPPETPRQARPAP